MGKAEREPEPSSVVSGNLEAFLSYLLLDDHAPELRGRELRFGARVVTIRNGIPRFTPDVSYSSGNFSTLREKHPTLQLDSVQQNEERRRLILERTNWPREFFAGKTVLECGCGAGVDTEALLGLGARVLSADIAGVDTASENVGARRDVFFIQADITDLPLRPGSFDIVFCHRVLQHTPNPTKTLRHILRYVKPGGAVFVHSYSRDARQVLRWKYALRPITKRMDPDCLYRIIKGAAPTMFTLTNGLYRLGKLGRGFVWVFIPFLNYSYKSKYDGASREFLLEYAIHDTFDALSATYDNPMSENKMNTIAGECLDQPFEVRTASAVTLLRTVGGSVSG